MSTFLKIIRITLSVLGWTLLVLLLFPVKLEVLLQDSVLTADLSYAFLKFRLSPKKGGHSPEVKEDDSGGTEKDEDLLSPVTDSVTGVNDSDSVPPSQKTGDKSKEKSKEKEKGSVSETVGKIMRIAGPLLRPGYWLLRMILKAVHVRDVTAVVSVTGSDPASIGFRSGIYWALIGDLMKDLGLLFGKNVTYKEVTVFPCFGDTEPIKEKIGCTVIVCPLIIILLVIGFGLGYLFELIRNLLNRGGKNDVN